MSSLRRVIVGASGSPGSLQVLRYAQRLARDLDAAVVPVLAWLPPGGDLADRRTPCEELRRLWAQDARARLQDALNLAWGAGAMAAPIRFGTLYAPIKGSAAIAAAPYACSLNHGSLCMSVHKRAHLQRSHIGMRVGWPASNLRPEQPD